MSTNSDILQKLLEGLSNQDWTAISNLYAEDITIQWPLAVPIPVTIHGRQTLKQTLQDGWKLLELRASNIRIYETHDPEVVIAEYDSNGKVRATGKEFKSANVLVATIKNGQVVSARGYHNHIVASAALGILEQIIPKIDINPQI